MLLIALVLVLFTVINAEKVYKSELVLQVSLFQFGARCSPSLLLFNLSSSSSSFLHYRILRR